MGIRALVALASTAALLTACGDSTGSPPAPQQRPDTDAGLAHIHGLGVDPADGTLYAASHHGLFRIPASGTPERVAGNRQDTMGFTVVGPQHFLGSGHPAAGDSGPPHLGLIESTDAGQQWRTLSLAGKADFHALEAKHDLIYGYDSQTSQLMVSTDKQSWDRRARLALADFAVSPSDANVLLTTTQQGLARSTDGGRTFTPVPSTPVSSSSTGRTRPPSSAPIRPARSTRARTAAPPGPARAPYRAHPERSPQTGRTTSTSPPTPPFTPRTTAV